MAKRRLKPRKFKLGVHTHSYWADGKRYTREYWIRPTKGRRSSRVKVEAREAQDE